jgi:hypothetical protein
MRKSSIKLAGLAVSAVAFGSLGLAAPAALAAGNSGSAAGIVLDLGPFPGQVPANCPSDAATDNFALSFVSGNANKSGETIEGDAWLVNETLDQQAYFGHATFWGNETNFTATFHGSNSGGQTLNFHVTGNKPHGIQVANLTCS